jgi:hypothetical protein
MRMLMERNDEFLNPNDESNPNVGMSNCHSWVEEDCHDW